MKWGRWWLALTYTLATLVAQGVHVHDRGAESTFPESPGHCDETRPHFAGHSGVAHGEAPASCPSCQFRAQQSLWEIAPQPLPGLSLDVPVAIERTSTLPGSPLRTRCRAPPRD